MGRKFDIPQFYRSSLVTSIKQARRLDDQRKKDLSPSILDLGSVRFKIARHFGFCFGVENAIEIAYRALEENPDKKVYLLSEMIHNPQVNQDLVERGVQFLLSPEGQELISFDVLEPNDIVIIPAFGTTVALFDKLEAKGINPRLYNATCPFVEKVWKRGSELGKKNFTVIIHGRPTHEETKATFSHAALTAPSLVIWDRKEAELLASYLRREIPFDTFTTDFAGRFSIGFDPKLHLERIGVVNQTTMLATETQSISELLKQAMQDFFGPENISQHFADTRDTLCYATSENQDAVHALIESGGDVAVVVGGYNSSNTSHLVELLEQRLPTYYIKDAGEIVSSTVIRHLNQSLQQVVETSPWIPQQKPLEILLTAGASCPDAIVDQVLSRLAEVTGVKDSLSNSFELALSASLRKIPRETSVQNLN